MLKIRASSILPVTLSKLMDGCTARSSLLILDNRTTTSANVLLEKEHK